MHNQILVPSAILLSAVSALVLFETPVYSKPNGSPVIVQQSREDMITQRVSYADLDLSKDSGRATLVHRVRGAIRNVCTESLTVPTPGQYQTCQHQAWQGAKSQMDRAFLRNSNQVAIVIK